MNSKAKAKIKDFIILTIVLIAIVTFLISSLAIIEEMYNWSVLLFTSLGVLWWFAMANK